MRLDEVGERDGWRCWLCDESVDPDMSVNDPRGPSIDARTTERKAKAKGKGARARSRHGTGTPRSPVVQHGKGQHQARRRVARASVRGRSGRDPHHGRSTPTQRRSRDRRPVSRARRRNRCCGMDRRSDLTPRTRPRRHRRGRARRRPVSRRCCRLRQLELNRSAQRCRAASNTSTVVAMATFSDSLRPACGIVVQRRIGPTSSVQSFGRPAASLPMTMAIRPVRSVVGAGVTVRPGESWLVVPTVVSPAAATSSIVASTTGT